MPIGLLTLGSFVLFGGVSGVLTLIIYATIVADERGQLNSAPEITGMFIFSGLASIIASIVSARIITKYNKSLNQTGAKDAPPS